MYDDYGPNPYAPKHAERFTHMITRVRAETRWRDRPPCEMCGPFRGRYLRQSGTDEFGPIYRCRGCDEE
jgi:hypothetical protein